MIIGSGRAPGKVILFGEHAVVYGRPALAVPVTQVQAEAVVEPGAPGAGLTIVAADLGETILVRDAPADHPLATAARLTLVKFGLDDPDWRVTVRSTIPIASGMGSGAAVSAAIMRAIVGAANSKWQIADRQAVESANLQFAVCSLQSLSELVYEVERLHHGTPSGIDNTVVVYGQPVYFVRGQAPQTFTIGRPFALAIADTGIHSPTKIAVGDVRRAWEREATRFELLFDRIAMVVEAARSAIAAGEPERLGPLMDENQALLQEIGVSSPELDALVAAARWAPRATRPCFRRSASHPRAGRAGRGHALSRGARRQAIGRWSRRQYDRARDRGDCLPGGRRTTGSRRGERYC